MLSVLVVDDNDGFRLETCEYLDRRGWLAMGVATGEDAMKVLEDSPGGYEAIVLDRAMPGVTGDEVLRKLRAKKEFFNTCIIMATAFKDPESAISALKLGAFEYLIKPFEPQTLDSVLRAGVAWNRAHKMRRELLRSRDRPRLIESVKKLLGEPLGPESRVYLTLLEPGEHSRAAEWAERFGSGEEVLLERGRSAVSVPDPRDPTPGSMIAVLIRGSGDQLRGILSIETESENAFSQSWISVLRYYSDLIGIALELEAATEAIAVRDLYLELRHKIATNVQIVAMQARQLQRVSLSSPEESSAAVRERVRFIADNAAVIEAFAQDIKAFAADPGQPDIESVDISEVARSALSEHGPALASADIDKDVKEETGPTVVRTSREWLTYSLRCLIRNAFESIVDGRRQREAKSEDSITLTISRSESHVEILVRDTGIGFDEETRRLIFKPLFSTKAGALPENTAGESTGVERVERVLALMSRWVAQDPHSQGIPPDLGRGMQLLVRDGDVVEMFVGHSDRGGLDTDQLEQTSLCRVGLDSPLAPEWRGRGEGLYTVQKYMSRLGGNVSAASDGWDKGAEFRISLPR